MSLRQAIWRFSVRSKGFGSIYGDLRCCKNTIRGAYTLHAHECRRHPQSASRQGSKRVKRAYKKDVDPKVYTRNVVREISNVLRYSSWDSAQEQLGRFCIKWDSYTVNQVLKTHPPMEKAWLFFNWVSKRKGFKHDQFTYTTMLDIFGEAGRINSMTYVFQQMQEKGIDIDVVTYTLLLHWLSKNGDFDGAVKLWGEMKAKGCHPTVVSYTAFMKILFDNNRVEEATGIYKEMLQSGLSPTCHTYTILMEHLIRSGKCQTALEVFRKMQDTGVEPDKATCNILVEQCCKAGEAWAIAQILDYMKKKSLVLRYPIYLQAHETLKMAGEDDMLLQQVNPHICIEVFDKNEVMVLEQTASDRNSLTDRGLLMELLRKKNFVAIDRLFSSIMYHNIQLDSETVSKLIEANCTYGRMDAALQALEYSNNSGTHIELAAYLSLLGVMIRSNEFAKVLEVVEQMVKIELFLQPQLASTLVYRLGQSRELGIAVKVFDMLPEEMKSSAVYTALINACFSAGDPDKGIEIFRSMKSRSIHVARGTYNVLIRGLEMCGRVDEAKLYRKERRSLLMEEHVSEAVLVEEKVCDVLFEGHLV